MIDDARLYVILDRMEQKIEGLLAKDVINTNEIQSLKADLEEAKASLNKRLKPIEQVILAWNSISRVAKLLITGIIALGGLLTAWALIKEKFPW